MNYTFFIILVQTAANDIVPFTDMNMNLTMQVIQEIADDVIRTLSVTYDSSLYRYVLEYSFFQISPANSYTLHIYQFYIFHLIFYYILLLYTYFLLTEV